MSLSKKTNMKNPKCRGLILSKNLKALGAATSSMIRVQEPPND